jgi:hypothetical protein
VLETQRAAARQALADVEDDDLAWQQAQLISSPVAPPPADAAGTAGADVVRLAVVPDLDQPSKAARTAAETKAAIRAALQN